MSDRLLDCPDYMISRQPLLNHDFGESVFTQHAQREWVICDQGWCPFIIMYIYMYLYMYICMRPPKSLNCTLVVDLPFQTLTVARLLVEFID